MPQREMPIDRDGREALAGDAALRAMNEVSQALLQGRDTDQVLLLIARWARQLVGAAVSSLATPDAAAEWIAVRAADGEGAETVRGARLPFEGSLTSEVMQAGQPRMVHASEEAGRQPITLVPGMGPILLVPLTVAGRAFGTLAVANALGAEPFSGDDLFVVQTFADEATLALEYGQARSDQARLSIMEERERIAMELHDGVVQSLFVAGLTLQAVEAVVDDPEQIRARLGEAVGSIDRAIRDLREYVFGLGPGELDGHRLERDLRELAEQVQRSGRVATSVELDSRATDALSFRGAAILQSAREAMSNALRHSGGDRVALRFCCTEGGVLLEVSDNGQGFDQSLCRGRGRGLANLRARAEAMGGMLEVDSPLGRGTTLGIRIPL